MSAVDLDTLDGILPLRGLADDATLTSPPGPQLLARAKDDVTLTSPPSLQLLAQSAAGAPGAFDDEGPTRAAPITPLTANDRGDAQPQRPRAGRRWTLMALAAMVLLAVGAAWWVKGRPASAAVDSHPAAKPPPPLAAVSPAPAEPAPPSAEPEPAAAAPVPTEPSAKVVEPPPEPAVPSPAAEVPSAPVAPKPTQTETPETGPAPLVVPTRFNHDAVRPGEIDRDAVQRWLSACQGRVRVVGHTSASGSSEANYFVGLGRAVALRNYLRTLAPEPRRFRVESAGSTQPAAPNTTAAGRAANRRVVLSCES